MVGYSRRLQIGSLLLLLSLLTTPVRAGSSEKFYAAAYGLSPHVFVSVLVTNSKHALPNFLGYLEGLDYPKDRISLWLRTDHNVDGTPYALGYWCLRVRELYKSVDCHVKYTWTYPTRDPYSKSVHRSKNKARLRQQALEAAHTVGADYLLTLDADCFLVNPNTLHALMAQEKTIVAPMLDPPKSSTSSNFWMAKDETGHFVSDELYMPIVRRERVGCFQCPLVFGAVLVHLASPYAENLVYHPPHPRFMGPVDDVKQFAFSALNEGVGMHILNTEFFGFIMPNKKYQNINKASADFYQFKINTLASHPPLVYSEYAKRQRPRIMNTALGFDQVFVINLARRPERRARMTTILNDIGLNHTIFTAIDGSNLTDSYLEDELGIRYLESGLEEFEANNKKMRKGEVGCFLSHYSIWKKVVEEKLETVLVMEDDVKFKPSFNNRLSGVISEAKRFAPDWDFIYLGRVKVDGTAKESRVPRTRWLVKPAHSFLMLCYLLSRRGAEKLLAAKPLEKLLPTDEFISLMRGTPAKWGKKWELYYPVRNLNGYSAHPTLVEPTHFYGDKDHVTDTAPPEEMAKIWERQKENKKIKIDETLREDLQSKALRRQILKFKKLAGREEL